MKCALGFAAAVGLVSAAMAVSFADLAEDAALLELNPAPRPAARKPSILERGYKQAVEVEGEKAGKSWSEKLELEKGGKILEKDDRVEVEKVEVEGGEVEVEKVVTNVVERVVEKPVEVEKIVTNVVERIVVDREEEERLREELEAERAERERLEQLLPKKPSGGRQPVKITADSTSYDRKNGIAVFSGQVAVDDEHYQLHADNAYVFMDGTNSVRRLVATGNVAITNGLRRAYGVKASYYRQSGMVVLYGDQTRVAEVRDESKAEDQVVRGAKIKFWTESEQVEILEADISAPVEGGGNLLKSLR